MTPTQHDLFSYRDHYPHSPAYRRRSRTSRAAADAVKPRAATLRDKVLALLRESEAADPSAARGLTADECARILSESPFAIRPRLSELRRLGLIYDSNQTRRNESGLAATVWRATYNFS